MRQREGLGEKQWTGMTFGTGLMHRSLIAMLRLLDVRLFYVFSYIFVVPPSMLFREGSGHMYRFFRKGFGYGPLRAWWMTFKNHCMFAQVVIDRFAMYAGRQFQMKVDGLEHYNRLCDQESGFVVLSSHVGNYEMAGYTQVSDLKSVNALVYFGEKASVMENRGKMLGPNGNKMILVRDDMSHLFEIDKALTHGEIVSIPADRVWGSQKSIVLPFLGHEARFPMGPFSVATIRGLEVVGVNVMKTSTRGYLIHVTPLGYDKEAPRREQTRQLAEAYVSMLEGMVRRYPTQWYNYFDFWIWQTTNFPSLQRNN